MDTIEIQWKEDQDGDLQEHDLRELRDKLSEHHSLLRQQGTLWRQKSRMQWIEGEGWSEH